MRKIKFLLLLLCSIHVANAQSQGDTTAIIREFNQVMSFAVHPYLYFNSIMLMHGGPMADPGKTGNTLHNEFYKMEDDLYYGNEQEEIYLQDSLMVRINHSRKTIQLSKVDVATKKRMDLLPLKKGDMQKMLREHCLLSRPADEGDTGQIIIRSPEKRSPRGFMSSEMIVRYNRQSHLPVLMELDMHVRQDETEQLLDMLKDQGFDVVKMEQEKDGKKSLTMTQIASVLFGAIEMTKEKAIQMPLWKERIDYDDQLKNYSGKGRCEGYEIVKTF